MDVFYLLLKKWTTFSFFLNLLFLTSVGGCEHNSLLKKMIPPGSIVSFNQTYYDGQLEPVEQRIYQDIRVINGISLDKLDRRTLIEFNNYMGFEQTFNYLKQKMIDGDYKVLTSSSSEELTLFSKQNNTIIILIYLNNLATNSIKEDRKHYFKLTVLEYSN